MTWIHARQLKRGEDVSERIRAIHGDSREVLKTLADCSVDSCVCDPPYSLVSITKRWSGEGPPPVEGVYRRATQGFMGQKWDTGETAHDPEFWREVYRVLKPGAHVVAFGGTRTFHRLVCAIEDAGFEVRDQICWLFGSGFPKSHDVGKAMDRAAGAEREVIGQEKLTGTARRSTSHNGHGAGAVNSADPRDYIETFKTLTAPATDLAKQWNGWGTALKPSNEPVCLAQKPHEYRAEYDTIGSNIAALESCLWSLLPANIAERNFGLSRSEFGAVCASARWSAAERLSTRDALCEAMGTSRFVLALTSSLSTVSSWKSTWAEGSRPENTSITETELSTTIGLRTLKSLLSRITPASIMQAHRSGLWSIAHADHAERIFNASVLKLSGTLECSALAPVIAQAADNSLDAGVSPALAPICLARKPIAGTVAANVAKYGTGAINVDGCRVATDSAFDDPRLGGKGEWHIKRTPDGHTVSLPPAIMGSSPLGRWPANVIHDGSEEVVGAFPESESPSGVTHRVGGSSRCRAGGDFKPLDGMTGFGDSGSAARFFYTAKADSDDRIGSKHPTVKPIDLMQYLIRLVTPKGGLVLDPFAGTGTSGEAAFREGMRALLIEREPQYFADIERRIKLLNAGPDERARESIKASGKVQGAGPLFGEVA